jgi:formylglycine-generating enzyme required for sulfatase activity
MKTTSKDCTGNQIGLGCIALMYCVIQSGCTADRGSQITKDSHPLIRSSSTGMQLVAVGAGTFAMGSPLGEPKREVNETQHQVTLTKPFYLGVYEVTQGEFTHVMVFNPSTVKGSDRLPVSTVT